MGRAPCCSKVGLQRGPWTATEDTLLTKYIQKHGEGNWRSLPKKAGLLRCGKSCRLRWMNYLRPDIKRGNITPDEDDLIIRLHALLGNRWSLIAGRLPGRTDNEIKNYWNTHLSKRLKTQGLDPNTHRKLSKLPQVPQKRNNKNKSKPAIIVEQEKLKVYNPKAIRVSSLSSFSLISWNNCFGGDDKIGSGTEGVELVPCSNYLKDDHCEIGFQLIGDDQDQSGYHDLMNGYDDLECHSHLPTCGNSTLEKLYEEYQQLLMKEGDDQILLDQSFADSLLV